MSNTPTDTIRLTIDGTTVTVPKGTLVIEAARRVGVMIPHFCYHPKLKPDANCRMCLVEIEKMPKLQTACSTPVADGMSVRTATTVVNDAHKSVLEFILANHPLDCPVCDQGGRCDLQDFSHQYTPTTSRFAERKRIFAKEYFSPLIETQMNRCVQCLRCVRYCDEVMDVKALAPVGRGTMTEIKHFGAHPLDCEFCGGCVQICPVGAITSRLSMYEFRPWMLKRAETICTYCGDGCQITIQTKNNDLIEVNSAHSAGRNNGDLCARGFFGFHATTHPDRLTHPLIRRDGRLVEATWEEALRFAAEAITKLKLAHGAEAIGGLISGRCTNEDLFLFQKFMRLVVGSNKLDSSARYGHMNAIQAMRRVQGAHRWTVTFEDIAAADVLLLVGTNITETNPITGLKVKEAVKKHGATLVTIETLQPAIGTISNIANLATHHFTAQPAQFGPVVLALLKAIVEDGLGDQQIAAQSSGFVQAVQEALGKLSWKQLEQTTGVAPACVREAARAFAGGRRVVVLVGPGVLRQPGGYHQLMNLLDLLLVTGHLTRPGCGLAPLAEENNDQGAVDMGAVAELLPGGADLNDRSARERLITLWKEDLPKSPGATLTELIEHAGAGALKGLLVVGENPVGTLGTAAKTALAQLDFLLCQELFLTETAAMAHVGLPACSYAEKSGTFTNTEGHVQAVRQAVEPVGESRPDWEILSALSILMGAPIEYGDAREILKEIRSLIPGYGLLGPSPTPPKVHQGALDSYRREGFAQDLNSRYTLSPPPVPGHELTLLLNQSLFHSGKFSRRAKGLMMVQGTGALTMNPTDAEAHGLVGGESVRIRNGQGSFTATVTVHERVPRGIVVFPEHFDEEAKQLVALSVDPVTNVPYVRSAQVTLEKAT
jgi:formate dehydrogenase alpha subunit